jgi:hypothetical protein
MTYGPLTLSRPTNTEDTTTVTTATPTPTEQILAIAPVGAVKGAYSLPAGSPAVGKGAPVGALQIATLGKDFFGQTRKFGAQDIGAVQYVAPAPVLAAINPTSAAAGINARTPDVVPVTLTGSGLTGATAVTVSGAGVSCGTIVVISDTTVTASCSISNTAAQTARSVTVTTPGGISNAQTFTVTAPPPPPTVTGISPASGARGATVPVTVTGTSLTGATAVTVSGTGVTCTGIVVGSSTSLTASCAITTTAAETARTITVTAAGQTSAASTATFTVTAAPKPGFAFSGTGVTTNNAGASTLTVSGANPSATVTVTNSNTVSETISTVSAVTTFGGGTYSVTGGTCTPGTPLAAGASCTVVVHLTGTPTAFRNIDGTLSVASSTAGIPTTN